MTRRDASRDDPDVFAPFEPRPARPRARKLAPPPPGGIAVDATNLTGVTSAIRPSGKRGGVEVPGIQPAFGARPNGA